MQTVNINVLYLPPLSALTLCFPPVVLFAQLAADTWTPSYIDPHKSPLASHDMLILEALFCCSLHQGMFIYFFPSTHIWLISSHLMPSYQVASVKIILKVNNNTIINTVGHVYLYYFSICDYLDMG